MHANAANVLALFTIAASVAPTFAAPLSTIDRTSVQISHPALAIEQRSAAAIGKALADGAVEGLSAGAAGAAIDKAIDYITSRDVADLDARSLSAIEDFLSNIFKRDLGLEERSAAAIGKAVAAGLASGALEAGVTSLVDKFTRRDVEERSAAAIGKALADGAVEGLSAGAAGAAIDKAIDYFTTRDVAELNTRSLTAIENFFKNIFKRDYGLEERSAAAIGKAVAAGVASGALEAGFTSLVDKFTKRDAPELDARSLTAIEDFFKNIFKRDVEERSAAAIGKAVAAGVASGALEAGVTSLVDKLTSRAEGDMFVDDSTGVIYVDDGAEVEARSVAAIGKAAVKSVASIIKSAGKSRDAPEARSLTAIENFFGHLFNRDVVEGRSAAAIGKAVAAGVASGALEAGVTSLVDKLTSRSTGDIFVDDSTGIIYTDVDDGAAGEKRAIGAIVKGLATGAGAGLLKTVYDDLTSRSINELD